jgi:hypothetical protein
MTSSLLLTKHKNNKERAEMTLEKLQLIATVSAASPFKGRWLRFWNSIFHTCQEVHFQIKRFTNRDLDAWLNRASFWPGMSNQSP